MTLYDALTASPLFTFSVLSITLAFVGAIVFVAYQSKKERDAQFQIIEKLIAQPRDRIKVWVAYEDKIDAVDFYEMKNYPTLYAQIEGAPIAQYICSGYSEVQEFGQYLVEAGLHIAQFQKR